MGSPHTVNWPRLPDQQHENDFFNPPRRGLGRSRLAHRRGQHRLQGAQAADRALGQRQAGGLGRGGRKENLHPRVLGNVVRAVPRQHPAPDQAAGKIHSDIARGFVRAEVVHIDEILNYNSEKEAKEKGIIKGEGKNYIINSGDVVNFLFSV